MFSSLTFKNLIAYVYVNTNHKKNGCRAAITIMSLINFFINKI